MVADVGCWAGYLCTETVPRRRELRRSPRGGYSTIAADVSLARRPFAARRMTLSSNGRSVHPYDAIGHRASTLSVLTSMAGVRQFVTVCTDSFIEEAIGGS